MSHWWRLASIGLLTGVLLAACSSPTSPSQSEGLLPQAMGAVNGVDFLPPVGDAGVLTGNFDPNVDLSIEVFALSNGEATGAPLGPTFATGDGSITVTNDPNVDEEYHANWDTSLTDVEDGTSVRVEVRLSNAPTDGPACNPATADLANGCLAFFDVQLWRNMGQVKKTQVGTAIGTTATYDTFDLTNGRTLPIKVHIEQGAADLPPVAHLEVGVAYYNETTGTFVVPFRASTSTDDHGIVSYRFRASEGDPWIVILTPTMWTFEYDQGGNYIATLMVTDTSGQTSTDTAQVNLIVPIIGPPK